MYADDHTPEYMDHLGNNYLLMKDNKGSIIGALNTSSGKMSQALTYSEWGAVLTDTSAGFQPFGFAGGLYDGTTKTLRFGAREYDPEIGRWTAKDPIGFEGGDGNLYGYVYQDPVNFIDYDGKTPYLACVTIATAVCIEKSSQRTSDAAAQCGKTTYGNPVDGIRCLQAAAAGCAHLYYGNEGGPPPRPEGEAI